jgi:hypothetical protein
LQASRRPGPMSSWPDPGRAHALVIGTETYDDPRYANLPAASASAQRIAELIRTGMIWDKVPARNIEKLTGRVQVRDAARAIQRKAEVPDLSALLIYICGHGQRWTEDHIPDKNLHFAFSDSDHSWAYNHLPFLMVRMLARSAQAAATLLIIDCCYADGAFLAADDLPRLDAPGICTMVATRWSVRAPASWPGTDYTAFSGALIDVIEKGIPGPELYLTPDSVFRSLRQRLRAAGKPEPDNRGNGAQMFICRNRNYQPAPEQPFGDLPPTREIDPAGYAAAVRAAAADGRGEDAGRLVAEFCEQRAVAETARLAAMLRAADLGGLADDGIRRACAARSGSEIAQLIHFVHHQADLDTVSMLQDLARRPVAVLVGLRAALDARACDDCRIANDQLSEQVLTAWPAARLDELLRVLPGRTAGSGHD